MRGHMKGCSQVGHDRQGLPIGLQLIGRPWQEATIIRLASAVEHGLTTDVTRSGRPAPLGTLVEGPGDVSLSKQNYNKTLGPCAAQYPIGRLAQTEECMTIV
ncbi:Fatty acid amide hydrolase [Nymphaea thermarum]|nr:Fatty acid amide hydrolase [Nymphaea thermarum]